MTRKMTEALEPPQFAVSQHWLVVTSSSEQSFMFLRSLLLDSLFKLSTSKMTLVERPILYRGHGRPPCFSCDSARQEPNQNSSRVGSRVWCHAPAYRPEITFALHIHREEGSIHLPVHDTIMWISFARGFAKETG